MHAISRLVLHPYIRNIQTSWVKMGIEGAKVCLQAGANDLGGSLMNESITRAAGAEHGQEWPPAEIEEFIKNLGREPRMRNTFYEAATEERHVTACNPPQLDEVENARAGKIQRSKRLATVITSTA